MANEVAGLGVADEISFAAGVTPCSLRIPVLGFDKQFGVLPVAESLPTGREHLLHNRFGKQFVGGRNVDAIDTRPQGFGGNECIDSVSRRGIHANYLSKADRKRCGTRR